MPAEARPYPLNRPYLKPNSTKCQLKLGNRQLVNTEVIYMMANKARNCEKHSRRIIIDCYQLSNQLSNIKIIG